jgi:hypothetical protein
MQHTHRAPILVEGQERGASGVAALRRAPREIFHDGQLICEARVMQARAPHRLQRTPLASQRSYWRREVSRTRGARRPRG